MDSDGLPLIGPGIDLEKVNAIQQKRLIAFINHFLTNSVEHLNKFSCVCEEKLSNMSTKIQRLETVINILETKIKSIPGLENINSTVPVNSEETGQTTSEPECVNEKTEPKPETSQTEANVTISSESDSILISNHPIYKQYFKMQAVGIPDMAVKQKMSMAGLDSSLLDDPNKLVPKENPTPGKSTDDIESDGFSDDRDSTASSDSVDFSD